MSDPSNYSNTCVPTLRTVVSSIPGVAEDNTSKASALADSFFPPLQQSCMSLLTTLIPCPSKASVFSLRARIRQVIRSLSPYKALVPDQIPNIVLMKCCDTLIDHLFYIFRAVIELNVYHPRQLESLTLVLHKISKTSYDIAKSYRPIGLIDTIPKVLATLGSKHVSYLAEKHSMLPPTQFGGRPGRNTTDAMLLVLHKIKDAWR